jgi:hypothetical protein
MSNCSQQKFRNISRPLQEETFVDFNDYGPQLIRPILELCLSNKYPDPVTTCYPFFCRSYIVELNKLKNYIF